METRKYILHYNTFFIAGNSTRRHIHIWHPHHWRKRHIHTIEFRHSFFIKLQFWCQLFNDFCWRLSKSDRLIKNKRNHSAFSFHEEERTHYRSDRKEKISSVNLLLNILHKFHQTRIVLRISFIHMNYSLEILILLSISVIFLFR